MSAANKTQKEPGRAKPRKAVPEFQCHIKYKNELPLPPVSAVLFDASVALNASDLFPSTGTGAFSTAYSAYEPTTFDRGVASHALPADLLQMAMFNFVDLDRLDGSRGTDEHQKDKDRDKDLFVSIEELERKTPGAVVDANRLEQSSAGSSTVSSKPSRSYVRPEVTWLRRTEYISSSKSGNRGGSGPAVQYSAAPEISRDEMQQLLSEPADWPQLVQAVEETFAAIKQSPMHPTNRNARLVQSFELLPEGKEDLSAAFAHCFFMGDPSAGMNGVDPTAALLQSAPTVSEGSSDASHLPVPSVFCYLPATAKPSDRDTVYHYAGDFEFQKQSSVAAGRNWALMLPVGEDESRAQIARIRGSWSLRKRRTVGSGRRPDLKVSRLSPMEE